MKKSLTLSLIIPVYNEENHLGDCLESVASQTVMPDEVIVINNNSTDRTVEIAERFSFVKIIHEKKQGLIPARDKGFDTAAGEILGRIDADSILSPEWTRTVREAFEDEAVDAVTGPAKVFVDSHFPSWQSTFWSRVYFWYSLASFRFQILWGPNMAVRRQAWLEVRNGLCEDDRMVHEDQDLSVLLKAHGKKMVFLSDLLMSTDGRRLAYLPKAIEYSKRHKLTLKLHKNNGNLQKARQRGGMSFILSKLLLISLLPVSGLYGLLAGIYSIEKKIGIQSDI